MSEPGGEVTGENAEAFRYNVGLQEFIEDVAGSSGGSTRGIEVWYGPYNLTYQTPDLASDMGHQLFTPKIGDWIVGLRFILREGFVCPEGGYPRLAFGLWTSGDVDIFGPDMDFSVGPDDHVLATVGPQLILAGGLPLQLWPAQFLIESPVCVNLVDGTTDPGLDKPGPAYTQAPTAGDIDLYFQIVSGSVLY